MRKLILLSSLFLSFVVYIPYVTAEQAGAGSLDAEINALSRNLSSERHLMAEIDGRFLADITAKLARASRRDILIKVLPGRLMSSQSDLGFAKYDNYLDLKGGSGSVDLREATLENIKDGRINVLIDLAGQVKAQAQGKQIGFNYSATPDIGVSMHDRVAFLIEPSGEEFFLRPQAKELIAHLDIGVLVDALGTKLNTSRDMPVDIAKLMRPIKLPHLISPDLRLPGRSRAIVLTNIGYRAEGGKLQLNADLGFREAREER
jgi:hypothetical protein